MSTIRLDLASDDAAFNIAKRNAKANDNAFYGWAVIQAGQAALNERTVQATPLPGNRYYADIALPRKSVENDDELKRHAQELADYSRWREPPGGNG